MKHKTAPISSSASEVLQRLATQNERIHALNEQVKTLNHGKKSYLSTLSSYYGAFARWKKLFLAGMFLTASYVALTLLLLPVLLILPLAGLYWAGSFFLSEHHALSQDSNNNTVSLLQSSLTESIDALSQSGDLLNTLITSTSALNDTLETAADVLERQNARIEQSNTQFEGATEALNPLIEALRQATLDTNQTRQGIIDILHQIHEVLGLETQALIDTTLPNLHVTLNGLEQSTQQLASMQSQYQERLIHLNALIEALDAFHHNQETGRTTGASESQDLTDELIRRAKVVSDEASPMMAMLQRDFPAQRSPSPLSFFNQAESGLTSRSLTPPSV
ncbi:MAG: hypothetical protein K0U24_03555 [Gammaproteobacteria bacterium]|nr:hypothetical protein [Gammaproteobacteria bacterium]